MKQFIIPLLAGVMLSCTQSQAQKLEFKEHITKEFTIKESGAKNMLAVYNISGSIKVKGYNGDKVIIEVDKTITADDNKTLEEGKTEFKVNFEQKGDSLIAYIAAPFDSRPNRNNRNSNNDKRFDYHYNLEYTIKVPYSMNLQVSTVNNGDVLVEDVAGNLNVANVNGAIKLTNAKGAAEVKTINGNVDANYLAVPPGESQFKTLNGNITITYPQSLSADCQFKSFNGEFYTDFSDTETLPVKLIKNQETNQNKTTYKVNAETAIRIGKGGQIFKFETFNGNIYLKNNPDYMKTHKLLAMIFVMAASTKILPLLAQNDLKEQITVPLSDPSKSGTLDVKLIRGSIHIIGYAGKEVIIDAVSKGAAEKNDEPKDEAAKGMKRISSGRNALDLTIEEEKNIVSIKPSMPRNPVNLTIKVPQHFTLRIGAINEGDIAVENVNGEFEISNVNGAIMLNNVSGSVVANTVNGNVKAIFKSINPESPMAFSTLNGNVDVTFPATAKFDVKLKSDRGEIFSDYDVDVDKTQPKAVKTTKDGLYKISISDWVQGKINGGGKEVMMKNMNGNIYVRKAK